MTQEDSSSLTESREDPEEEYSLGWRLAAQTHQYQRRYVGHKNVQTDIKEACFLGGYDDLVAAGSDDGNVFIYNAETGYPVSLN